MRPIITYAELTYDELKEELVNVTSALAGSYTELSGVVVDHDREYIEAYVRSPGHSVAAKEREAEYYVLDLSRQKVELQAKINALTSCRDLAVFLMGGKEPGTIPYAV